MSDAFSAHDFPVIAFEALSTSLPAKYPIPILGVSLATNLVALVAAFLAPSFVKSLETVLINYGVFSIIALPTAVNLLEVGNDNKTTSKTGSLLSCQLFKVLLI